MIKNAFIYTAKFSGTINRNELNRIAAGCPFTECQPTQHKSAGFVPPRQGGEMVEWIDDNVIMDIRIDTRKVPAEAVRKEVDRMAALIEDQTGRKPGKKQRKELAGQAEHELMPKVFTKTAVVRVWISLAHGFAVLGTGSQGMADKIMTSLVMMLDGIADFGVVQTQMSPTAAMTHWLGTGEAPYNFTVDRECELKSIDEMKSVVKYNRHNLDTDEVKQHIVSGKVPTRVALTWRDRVSFVLTDALTLKKIALLDVVMLDGKDKGEDAFTADATIFTAEMSDMLDDLSLALGGLTQPAAE